MGRSSKWIVFAALLTIGGGWATEARAQHWSNGLFSEGSHDFGSVPRGAKVRHPFVLTNRLNTPITIVGLRVSCGCTSGIASASVVQPGQTAVVEAQMDTRNFVGRKSTVLYVNLQAGNEQAEVSLGVSSNILSDVVLNPGSLDFGTIARGQSPTLTLTVDRVTQPNWRIVKMVSASKVLNASLRETARSGDQVSYVMNVSIKPEASAGMVRDEIRLLTNDPETPSVPVLVTAQVVGDLAATPSVLSMGNVNASAGATGRFIVRSSKPFTIVKIEGEGDGFKLADADKTAKPLHILALNYKPEGKAAAGVVRKTFKITTDIPGEAPIEVSATLNVNP